MLGRTLHPVERCACQQGVRCIKMPTILALAARGVCDTIPPNDLKQIIHFELSPPFRDIAGEAMEVGAPRRPSWEGGRGDMQARLWK